MYTYVGVMLGNTKGFSQLALGARQKKCFKSMQNKNAIVEKIAQENEVKSETEAESAVKLKSKS